MTSHRRRKLFLAYVYCCIGLLPKFVLNIVIPIDTCEVAFGKKGLNPCFPVCDAVLCASRGPTNNNLPRFKKEAIETELLPSSQKATPQSQMNTTLGNQGSINVYHLILSSRILRIGSA